MEKSHNKYGRKIQCGLCAQSVIGDQKTFFAHHRICLMKKMNSIICPYCPTLFFDTKQSYILHLTEIHQPANPIMMCVFCGQNLATWFELLKHQSECFPNSNTFQNCEYCDMGFVFSKLDNVFYFAHVNNAHRKEIQQIWNYECSNCGMKFEQNEFLEHHSKLCFQGPDALKIEDKFSGVYSRKDIPENIDDDDDSNDIQPTDLLETELTLKSEEFDENSELITGDV